MSKQKGRSPGGATTKTLVLFGTDEHDKPRAARFVESKPELVAKAGKAMELRFAEIKTEDQANVAQKLPTGRLYSTGRGFVPYIRRDLYGKLLAAFGLETGGGQTADKAAAVHRFPCSYDEIVPGDLVLVQETLEYGWWEAIVLERNGEMLTVRWRDYKAPKFVRHLDAVALIRPPAPPAQPADVSAP